MYFISAALSGIKLTYCIINSHRKTVENKKDLFACQKRKDIFSKSLEENKFMDEKRKNLFEKISKRPI